jgi:hypothetical protein
VTSNIGFFQTRTDAQGELIWEDLSEVRERESNYEKLERLVSERERRATPPNEIEEQMPCHAQRSPLCVPALPTANVPVFLRRTNHKKQQ